MGCAEITNRSNSKWKKLADLTCTTLLVLACKGLHWAGGASKED